MTRAAELLIVALPAVPVLVPAIGLAVVPSDTLGVVLGAELELSSARNALIRFLPPQNDLVSPMHGVLQSA